MSSIKCQSPVLFLIFNRPDLTSSVFESIRAARPKRLYVAADGPRANFEGEIERCRRAREIATAVDWDCEVNTLFREQNLGCGKAVSEAISWFFDNVEEGIIIEDDVLVHPTWFRFADEMLERYRSTPNIFCITATGYGSVHGSFSYVFSIYNHCWGWASWRRAWQSYDYKMLQWPRLRNSNWLRKTGSGKLSFACLWRDRFDAVKSGEIDTWDYQWTYSAWLHEGISIHPRVNMAENIGFRHDATHTKEKPKKCFPSVSYAMKFPLVHQKEIRVCEKYDQVGLRRHFKLKPWYPISSKLWSFRSYRWIRNFLRR